MAPSWLFACLAAASLSAILAVADDSTLPQTYIIHMSKLDMPRSFRSHLDWYSATLNSQPDRIIYTYDTAFHGFAARLTKQEAERIEATHGVVAVVPDTLYELHTTRSPEF